MEENTLEELREFQEEIGMPERAFKKMLKLMRDYQEVNNLSEAEVLEIMTTTMTFWESENFIKRVFDEALVRLGYSKNMDYDDDEKMDTYHSRRGR